MALHGAGLMSIESFREILGIPIEEWVAERRAFSETWITERLTQER